MKLLLPPDAGDTGNMIEGRVPAVPVRMPTPAPGAMTPRRSTMLKSHWYPGSLRPFLRFDLPEVFRDDLVNLMEFSHHFRVIGRDAEELHPGFFSGRLGHGQLVLECCCDVVFETDALPRCRGFHLAEQGIGEFDGRAHESIFMLFHDLASENQ